MKILTLRPYLNSTVTATVLYRTFPLSILKAIRLGYGCGAIRFGPGQVNIFKKGRVFLIFTLTLRTEHFNKQGSSASSRSATKLSMSPSILICRERSATKSSRRSERETKPSLLQQKPSNKPLRPRFRSPLPNKSSHFNFLKAIWSPGSFFLAIKRSFSQLLQISLFCLCLASNSDFFQSATQSASNIIAIMSTPC